MSAIRCCRGEPRTTSSRSLPRGGRGSPRYRPTAEGSSKLDRSAAAASCFLGAAAGGRHRQEWLCTGRRYLEIQLGSATTQLEHLRLEGGAGEDQLGGGLRADRSGARDRTRFWPDALTEVAELVARAVPDEALDEWHQWWRAAVADATPVQMTAGSGAGEAELIVRGEDPEGLPGTPFGHPTLDGFRQLVVLARTGQVHQDAAGAVVLVPPLDRWEPVLDRAADGWWSRLMYAIRCHARGELAEARLGYLRSYQVRPTPWATRGLAMLAGTAGDQASAAHLYARAVARAPDRLPLLVEATEQLLAAGRPGACLAMIDAAPRQVAAHGRLVLQRARALLADGQADAALVRCSEPGSRSPTFGRERRWVTCGARRSATGRCPTTPTSGCVPTRPLR